MAITKINICEFTDREAFKIRVTWPFATSNFVTGTTVTKAYLTIKHRRSDADGSAILQKTITTADVPGTGQIENDGGADEDMVFRFDLTATNTTPSGDWPFRKKEYDVKVVTGGGDPVTVVTGQIWAGMGVTKAVA